MVNLLFILCCDTGRMANPQCQLCKRDISKPALVRCRDDRCPLKAEKARTPIGTLAGIGGAGVLVLGLVALFSWHMTANGVTGDRRPSLAARTASDTGHVSSSSAAAAVPGSARPARVSGAAQGGSWFTALFASPAPAAAAFAAAPDQSVLDARAPTRVQNFSCSGALSASRAAICGNWSLAIGDYNLSLVYRSALARSVDARALRRDHARWLAKLDTLANDPAAIERHYDEWRARLDADAARR